MKFIKRKTIQSLFVVVQHVQLVLFEEPLENVHRYLYASNHDESIHFVNNTDRVNQNGTRTKKSSSIKVKTPIVLLLLAIVFSKKSS